MKLVIKLITLFIFFIPMTAGVFAHQEKPAKIEVINDLQVPVTRALEYAAAYGSETTLIVFDIDDTLLTMTEDLGSHGWLKWQITLLRNAPDSSDLVAQNFDDLIQIQYFFFNNMNMRPAQENLSDLLQQLNDKNIPTFALTARGGDIRNATENMLEKYKISFNKTARCIAPLCMKRGDISGAELVTASKKILSAADLEKFKLTKTDRIGVSGGLMMVAGQNKGLMLRLLLKSMKNTKIHNVIFVDDSEGNVKKVRDAFTGSSYRISIFHYDKFKQAVSEFQKDKARQTETTRLWQEIRKPVCKNLKPDWCK